MSWNELPLKPKSLEADMVNKVFENCVFIAEALESKGIEIQKEDMTSPNAQVSTIIAEVVEKLTTTEENLTIINSGTSNTNNIVSIYYEQPWELNPSFTLGDYQRWILILNDLYDIIVNEKGLWFVLELNDCIPTINDKDIAIRGEVIA